MDKTATDEINIPSPLDIAVNTYCDFIASGTDDDAMGNAANIELAALRKVATIAADVNEWLIKIDLGGTGHQRGLEAALKELEAVK